jgi:hypothetical protein
MNRRIQGIKIRSRGFRNKARDIQSIYFPFGGMDLSIQKGFEYKSDPLDFMKTPKKGRRRKGKRNDSQSVKTAKPGSK